MRLTEFSEFSGYATVRAVSVDKLHAVHLWRYLHCIVAVLSVVLQWIDVPCCYVPWHECLCFHWTQPWAIQNGQTDSCAILDMYSGVLDGARTPCGKWCFWAYPHFPNANSLYSSVRPILRIGEYWLVVLQHRRIRYIGLRVSADAE